MATVDKENEKKTQAVPVVVNGETEVAGSGASSTEPTAPMPEAGAGGETTGVENVSVDAALPQRPANWQGAVKAHFTPQPKPKIPTGAVAPSNPRPSREFERAIRQRTATGDEEATPGETPHSIRSAMGEAHTTDQESEEGEVNGDNNTSKAANPSLQEIIDFLQAQKDAIHLPTKEELEKERRRKRTEGIISSIADGASAISNLIFTTKYAPDMYRQENSMTGKMRERYERLKKQREADADRYLNYALMINKLQDAEDAKEYQRGRDALQDRITSAKAEYNAKMADIKYRIAAQKLSDAEAAAEEKEANKELDKEIKQARLEEIRSRKRKNDRWQPKTGGSGRGGSRGGRHPWRDDKGVFGKKGAVIYETSKDGAREMAQIHGGTYLTTPSTSVTTKPDRYGRQQTHTTVKDTSTPTKGANTRKLGL